METTGLHKKIFTKEMRKDYTILIPQMAPIHFELLETAVRSSGYHVELLRECTQKTVETGLKYVNNDACYPSILVTGQMIEALQSGKYDLNKTALIMSQTGGGCRATNYIGFIRKALKDAGFEHIPVISFNIVGIEKMPGFKLTVPLAERLLKMVVYGDLLQKMLTKNRAYEKNKGETQKLFDTWLEKCKKLLAKSTTKEFKQSIYDIVNDLDGVLSEFDRVLGLELLKAVHLNDSMMPFGSQKDRHAVIGGGEIGMEALLRVLRHPVLKDLPFYLETPLDDKGHKEEIRMLREKLA